MQFQQLVEWLADEFHLPPPPDTNPSHGCELLFDDLPVRLTPHESGTACVIRSELGQIGTPDFQDRIEELLTANLFSNPTGEGVLGLEVSGMAVLRFRISYRDMTPTGLASTLRRFAAYGIFWKRKISAHIHPQVIGSFTPIEMSAYGRI